MNKQEQIEVYLKEPIKVGDVIKVRGLGTQDKNSFFNSTPVHSIGENGSVFILVYGHREPVEVKEGDYVKSTDHLGYNPFATKPWNSELRMINFNLESILGMFVDRRKSVFKTEQFGDVVVPELNWNPTMVDSTGKDVEYQRDFCWSLKDKQLLIDSIYNYVDIGKIVVRTHSYEWVKKRVAEGKSAGFRDIVDGKQRLNAIIGFYMGEFPDSNGQYYNDLSEQAKRHFTNFQSMAYGELGDNCSDEDVKAVFLAVNFTGVQMSQEHIAFVQSISLK